MLSAFATAACAPCLNCYRKLDCLLSNLFDPWPTPRCTAAYFVMFNVPMQVAGECHIHFVRGLARFKGFEFPFAFNPTTRCVRFSPNQQI